MLSLPDFKEKKIIYVTTSRDQSFSFRNDNLVIKDQEGKIIQQISCFLVFALFIVGHTTITSGLLQRSKKYGFPIYLFSHGFRLYGHWAASTEGNTLLRGKQYTGMPDYFARHIISNKIDNQYRQLQSLRQTDEETKQAIIQLKEYRMRAADISDGQQLLGIEGVAARVYFCHWFKSCDWTLRRPRAKHDITNLLLDMGYTYLFSLVESMLHLYGFDLYVGFYHKTFYQRKSLVCDLVEPFRCLIDRQVRNAWQRQQIDPDDFRYYQGQYSCKFQQSEKYSAILLKCLWAHKEDIFLYIQTFYRHLMGNKSTPELPFFSINR